MSWTWSVYLTMRIAVSIIKLIFANSNTPIFNSSYYNKRRATTTTKTPTSYFDTPRSPTYIHIQYKIHITKYKRLLLYTNVTKCINIFVFHFTSLRCRCHCYCRSLLLLLSNKLTRTENTIFISLSPCEFFTENHWSVQHALTFSYQATIACFGW